MNQLKELFESALLNDESKAVLKEAFEVAVKAKETELEAQYVQKLSEAEAQILEQLPKIVEEAVSEELSAIAEEVAHARTLEVQYAEKLNVFKESYAEKHEEQLKVMVAEAVAEEYEELKEDIEVAKKHEFVMSMFETFKNTYEQLFGGTELSVIDELKEAKQELDQYKRKEKLAEILESVQGNKRLIAQTILEGVATDKLEEKFESIREVLLAEAEKKEETPLVESAKDEKEIQGKVVIEESLEEQEQPAVVPDAIAQRLQKSLKLARR